VLLTGSPKERPLLEAIRGDATPSSVHVLEDEGVPDLAAAIARASLLVGNNSGPMHLADAVGCPMVILYSGTDFEEQWRPRGARSRLLRRPTNCHPCYRFECPFNLECLDLPPATVVEACEELLDTSSGSSEPADRPTLSRLSCGSDRLSGAARP
jgi:ADP-heptose:LPS heptosyltransferase